MFAKRLLAEQMEERERELQLYELQLINSSKYIKLSTSRLKTLFDIIRFMMYLIHPLIVSQLYLIVEHFITKKYKSGVRESAGSVESFHSSDHEALCKIVSLTASQTIFSLRLSLYRVPHKKRSFYGI